LEIPKTQWRALAALLAARLAGQSSLLDADYPDLVAIADWAFEHRHIVDKHWSDKSVRQAHQDHVVVADRETGGEPKKPPAKSSE
jgi:hypothetical protein